MAGSGELFSSLAAPLSLSRFLPVPLAGRSLTPPLRRLQFMFFFFFLFGKRKPRGLLGVACATEIEKREGCSPDMRARAYTYVHTHAHRTAGEDQFRRVLAPLCARARHNWRAALGLYATRRGPSAHAPNTLLLVRAKIGMRATEARLDELEANTGHPPTWRHLYCCNNSLPSTPPCLKGDHRHFPFE